MKSFIAAAALAVAGTSASAAVYEVDFTAEVTSADEFFAFSEGDVTTNSFTFGEQDGPNPYVTIGCEIFGYSCNSGGIAEARFGDDGSLISFGAAIKSIYGGPGFDASLSSGTGQLRDTDVESASPLETLSLNFEITDSTVTVSDPNLAPVPLPASAPLLALGLGGLAWMRRRSA